MLPPYPGHCLCGRISFRLNAEPLTLYACHCTDCQRRSGGALLLAMWVQRESLELLEGEAELVSSVANDGRERRNRVVRFDPSTREQIPTVSAACCISRSHQSASPTPRRR